VFSSPAPKLSRYPMCSYVSYVSYVVFKKGNTKIHNDDSTEIHKDNEILGWEVSGLEVQPITILYNTLQSHNSISVLMYLLCLMWFLKRLHNDSQRLLHKEHKENC
jgi:succinate-acetate transporter protein